MKPIDLRSDTVTKPSPAMREAMGRAEVGDDVFGDDPTVNKLQEVRAERFGMQAGLFFPSGTQSNLAAVMAHCARGEEVIVGQDAHTYRYEAGGAAVLGSIQPQPLTNLPDGSLDLSQVEAAIKPDDSHFAITRLLALENTIGGKVLSRQYMADAIALARRRKLSVHLDGARIFNAAVKLGMPVKELCAGFDTVSVCLSKGSARRRARCSSAERTSSTARAASARCWAGPCGRWDPRRGRPLRARAQRRSPRRGPRERRAPREGPRALGSRSTGADQHGVRRRCRRIRAALKQHLDRSGVVTLGGVKMRLVTHLDVDAPAIDRALAAFGAFFKSVPAHA
jgi:threonine aldolase